MRTQHAHSSWKSPYQHLDRVGRRLLLFIDNLLEQLAAGPLRPLLLPLLAGHPGARLGHDGEAPSER